MIQYTFDHEIQTMITVFMNAMSDIVIRRFNVHKKKQDQIKTRLVYAPKQRVLADLLDRDQNLQLPVMACSIGGIARDSARVFNKLLGTFNQGPNNTFLNERMPIPIDLTLNVSLLTRYQSDMDQILTHLLPYVNPYFAVSWRTPGRPDHEIRSNVFWSGTVNLTYPQDQTATVVARVAADMSFTFKGWMFQALPDEPIGTILTIHTNYNNSTNGVPSEYLLNEDSFQTIEHASTPDLDYVPYLGVPPRPKVIIPHAAKVGSLQTFKTYGSGFTKITNIYLSGAPVDYLATTVSPFLTSTELSADFPAFTGVKLDQANWSYDKDNSATFVMPSADRPGLIDLIIEGPAGYGKLTENVRIDEFNPYKEGSSEFAAYVPYQLPYLSGIEIFS